MTDHEVQVTMTFTATVPEGYGPHEVADAIRFHVDLSELDAIEADISAIDIIDAREIQGVARIPRSQNPGRCEETVVVAGARQGCNRIVIDGSCDRPGDHV